MQFRYEAHEILFAMMAMGVNSSGEVVGTYVEVASARKPRVYIATPRRLLLQTIVTISSCAVLRWANAIELIVDLPAR